MTSCPTSFLLRVRNVHIWISTNQGIKHANVLEQLLTKPSHSKLPTNSPVLTKLKECPRLTDQNLHIEVATECSPF